MAQNKSESMNKDSKIKIALICGLGLIIVVLIVLGIMAITSQSEEGIPQELESIKEELIQSYSNNGVELTSSDIEITTDEETGETSVEVVNEEKKNNFYNKTDSNLRKKFSDLTGIDLPDNIGEKSSEDSDEWKASEITVGTIIKMVNEKYGKINQWLEEAMAYQDKEYPEDYVRMLLNQRQTGKPSSNTEFPIVIYDDIPQSYQDFNYRLNGLCFWNVQYPDRVVLDDYKYFNPYVYSFWSEDIYNNILNKKKYKSQIKEGDLISIEDYEKEYNMYTNSDGITYDSYYKIKTTKGNIIVGIENMKFILLDVE